MGSFPAPERALTAARELRDRGHTDLDAYSPFPLEDSEEALGLRPSPLPRLVAAGGFAGAASGYLLQYYCNAVSFPINIGGRPPHSPPSFIPITFECAILFGAFAAFFGVLTLVRLPRLHHPVFEAPGFDRASIDRCWLSASTGDPGVRARLESDFAEVGASEITVVEEDDP
jgi:hypothetical protein